MSYCYTSRPEHCSTTIRQASCSRQQLTQGHTMNKRAESVRQWSTKPSMRCFYQIPPLKAQGALQKRTQKDSKCWGWQMTPRKYCLLQSERMDKHKLTETETEHTSPMQVQNRPPPPPLCKGKQTQSPMLTQELQLLPTEKGKFSSLQCSVTGCINHTPWQASCPGVVGQHKMESMFFVNIYIYIYISFVWIFLSYQFSYLYFVFCLFFERERI